MSAAPEVLPESHASKSSFSVLDSFKVVKDGKEGSEEADKAPDPSVQTPPEAVQTPSRTVLPDPEKRAVAPLSPKASENFRKLEESKTAAEKERDALKTQIQGFDSEKAALQKQIEEMKGLMGQQRENTQNADGLQLTVETQQQKIAELQRELKAAAVTRDPEFQDKFIHTKKFQQDLLSDFASIAGIAKDDVERSLRSGDESRLQEIRDSLPPKQQRGWDAALLKMEQIDQDRQMAEKDAEKTYDQLQAQRNAKAREAAQATQSEDRRIAKTVMRGIFDQVPALKENKDLSQELASMAEAISGGKGAEVWTKETIINGLMFRRIYENACAQQHGLIEKLETDLKAEKEERKKLEGALKTRGIPYGEGGFNAPAPAKGGFDSGRRLTDQIVVRKA